MQKILSLLRRCVEDYDMIAPGERVAVGVSGGKDSLVLLAALARLAQFYPGGFSVEAFTVDMGAPGHGPVSSGGLLPGAGRPLPPDSHPDVPCDL